MKNDNTKRIVKLKGGLGNQLFQYSFAKLIQHLTHENVKLDITDYKTSTNSVHIPHIEKLNITLKVASKQEVENYYKFPFKSYSSSKSYKLHIFLEQLINPNYFFEFNCKYKKTTDLLKYRYYNGYWQSWKYLVPIESILRNEFVPKQDLSDSAKKTLYEIKNCNSVFIGIRRGDYLTSWRNRWEYGTFNMNYYLKAMNYIYHTVKNPIFYIFSNDIDWVKHNMDFSQYKVKFREKEYQLNDFEEFILMSSCKHGIIANSTFHWWAAWLINNPNKKIIAPKRWFANKFPIDIIPPSWIQLEYFSN